MKHNQLINNYMNHLFHRGFFKVGSKLRPLLECMFASILMYHSSMLNKFGQTHIINLNMIRSAREFSVSENVQEEWEDIIRFDWQLRNTKLQSNNDENRALMDAIINNNTELQKSNIQQMREIKIIRLKLTH